MKYYKKGKIEVIDFIVDQQLGFREGNVVKYICRYKHKSRSRKHRLQDLRKARHYIQMLIDEYETALG